MICELAHPRIAQLASCLQRGGAHSTWLSPDFPFAFLPLVLLVPFAFVAWLRFLAPELLAWRFLRFACGSRISLEPFSIFFEG